MQLPDGSTMAIDEWKRQATEIAMQGVDLNDRARVAGIQARIQKEADTRWRELVSNFDFNVKEQAYKQGQTVQETQGIVGLANVITKSFETQQPLADPSRQAQRDNINRQMQGIMQDVQDGVMPLQAGIQSAAMLAAQNAALDVKSTMPTIPQATIAKMLTAMSKGETPDFEGLVREVMKSPNPGQALGAIGQFVELANAFNQGSAFQEQRNRQPGAKGGDAPTVTPEEAQEVTNLRGEFDRREASRGATVGTGMITPPDFGKRALDAYESMAGQTGEGATLRAELLEAARLARKIEVGTGAIGTTFDDLVDRNATKGLSKKELDRLDEIILNMKKNGIELVD
jgi:hypothetical protein